MKVPAICQSYGCKDGQHTQAEAGAEKDGTESGEKEGEHRERGLEAEFSSPESKVLLLSVGEVVRRGEEQDIVP